MKLDARVFAERLLLAALFLLPWQTRWIFALPALHGGAWEYGVGSAYVVELLIFLAACLSLLRKGRLGSQREHSSLRPHAWPLVVFFALACLSAAFGPVPAVSFAALIHLVVAIVLGFAMSAAGGLGRGRTSASSSSAESLGLDAVRMSAAFVAGLVPAAALGWFQTLTGANPASKWFGLASRLATTPGVAVVETAAGRLLRAYGPFSHPNVFGGYLAVGLLASVLLDGDLSLLRRGRLGSQRESLWASALRWPNALAAAFLAATLVITFSRAAFLALFLGLAVIAWRQRGRLAKNRAAAALAVGFVLCAAWFHGPLLSRASAASPLEREDVAVRLNQYDEFAAVFIRAPLLGVGTSAYTQALGDAFPARAAYDLQPVHNAFLLVLAEQGILGFLALAWLAWEVVERGTWNVERKAGAYRFLLPAAVLLPLALFDHYLWSSWAGLALVAAAFVLLSALAADQEA